MPGRDAIGANNQRSMKHAEITIEEQRFDRKIITVRFCEMVPESSRIDQCANKAICSTKVQKQISTKSFLDLSN